MRILILTLLLISNVVFGQAFSFIKSGLLNTNVKCLVADQDFLWIGTDAGINRISFDENFKPTKISPRGTSFPVLALANDGDNLWVGLKGKGVYRMPKENYKFIGFQKDILGDKIITGLQVKGKILLVDFVGGKLAFNIETGDQVKRSEEITTQESFMVGGKSLLLVIPQLLRTNEATKSSKALTIHAKINQGLIFKNQLFLATSRGLGLYHPDKDPITFGDPTLSLASAKINGANLSNGDQLPWDEYTLNLAFTFEEMGVDSNITLNYVLDGKEFSVKGSTITIPELEHGQHNLTISAINDKGVKTVNETGLEFSIENPAIDRIINYIIIGAIILAYSLMLIFIIRKKFKKDIRVLEDALLEKTNRLNQLERGKYGLVEEEKVKLK